MADEGILLGVGGTADFRAALEALEEAGISVNSVDVFSTGAFPYLSKDLGIEDTGLLFLVDDTVVAGLENICQFATRSAPAQKALT